MPDYSNSKLYKICSYETDQIYIGSTTQTLSRRMSKHRSNYKLWLKGYIYPSGRPISNYSSFRILEQDPNCKIILISKHECNDRAELETIERDYINSVVCVNKNVGSTKDPDYYKKYYVENKEHYQNYYIKNKDKINIRRNKKFNCDCGGKYSLRNKSQHEKTNKHIIALNK